MAIGSEARSTFLAIVKGDASQAVTEFKKLGNSVEKSTKGAEGSVGKFKTFTNGAFKELKANAGMFAAGAGIAIGAFVSKAVDEFARLGVQVGKFSDATGIAAEEASRWIEVAGDIGIEASTVEKALGRLNKSIDPEKFRELGIEIAKTADGATDVNGTFLNVIDKLNKIKDPAEKARVASKLLGKGWQEMAELIGQGSASLSKSLAEVSDAKVIDESEVRKARDYRAAMDKLNDAFQDIMITVGEELAPAVSAAADDFADLIGILRNTNDGLEKVADTTGADVKQAFENVINPLEAVRDGWRRLQEEFGSDTTPEVTESMDEFTASANKGRGALNEWNPAARAAKEKADELADSTRKLDDATKDYTASYAELIGKLDEQEAWEGVIEKVFAAADGIDDTAAESRDAKRELAEYIDEFANIPDSVKTSLIAKLDKGAVNEVTAYLNGLRMGVTVPVKPVGSGLSLLGAGGKRANGGPVAAGVPYMVGERGPEMIVPNTNAMVLDAARTSRATGGGTYNTTIVVRQLPTERELIDLINSTRRKQGAVI